MRAKDLVQLGDLDGALALLQQDVRAHPESPELRLMLFEILALSGDCQRAATQLELVSDLEPERSMLTITYRAAIDAEDERAKVFAGVAPPPLVGEPQPWEQQLVAALQCEEVDSARAMALREEAFEAAGSCAGTVDNRPFEWFADGDTRLGPMLELIVDGQYHWVPLNRIHKLSHDGPQHLRNLVWLPCRVRWVVGGSSTAIMPVRYPGTENNSDPELRLARATEWQRQSTGVFWGTGQKRFLVDDGEVGLLDWRELELQPPEPSDDDAAK